MVSGRSGFDGKLKSIADAPAGGAHAVVNDRPTVAAGSPFAPGILALLLQVHCQFWRPDLVGMFIQFGKLANPASLQNWLRLIQRSAQQMNITTRANRPDVPKSSTTSRATAEMRRRSFERLLVPVRRRGVLRVQRAVARRCRGS